MQLALTGFGAPGSRRMDDTLSARSATVRTLVLPDGFAAVLPVRDVRPPHPPHRGHDLSQVGHVAPALVFATVMYLMTSTRCGISAKHIERELGVTYKTAWRMCNKIRNYLMDEDTGMLDGDVEADETWVGGKAKQYPKMTRQEHEARKASVFAAVERGGRIVAKVTPDSRAPYRHVRQFVMPTATLYTDDYIGYARLAGEYDHHTINHSAKVYVSGDVHTQTIEGFFGNFKMVVRGAHHSISHKWLQGYLNEWTWRYNHRDDGRSAIPVASRPSGQHPQG